MQTVKTPTPPSRNGSGGTKLASRGVLSTRRGSTLAAIVTAVLAAGLIAAYLDSQGKSADSKSAPRNVVVAKELIEKGTTGEAIAEQSLVERQRLPQGEVKAGALTDASALRGKVTSQNVLPGEQLTAGSLKPAGDAISARLSDFQRAISVPLDASHGLIGQARKGDKVDVFAGFNVTRSGATTRPFLRVLVRDALVLSTPKKEPGSSRGGSQEQVVLRVTDKQAQAIAFSSDNGKVWLVLRPPSRSRQSRLSAVTVERLLIGVPPIQVRPGGGIDEKGRGR